MDKVVAIPHNLQALVNKANLMTLREITQEISTLRESTLLDKFLCSSTQNDVIPAILCAMIEQMTSQKKEEESKNYVSRVLIAAFFEITDEVSDVIMAILFTIDESNFGWAATIMLTFIGTNRLVQMIVAYSLKLPFLEILESLIGVKCITDTYRLLKGGSLMISGTVSISTLKSYMLAIGLVCESLPQMILQIVIVLSELRNGTVNQGILVAQFLSVLASSLSVGISFASVSVDFTSSRKVAHPSAGKWYPEGDTFRETVLFLCLIVVNALHVLLVAFGYSCLFAFTPWMVSITILLTSFLLFTTLRYKINGTGWSGMGLYSLKSNTTHTIVVPLVAIIFFLISNAAPLTVLRYQAALGAVPFTYGVVTSMAISMISISLFIDGTSLRILFFILFFLYISTWLIFFSTMEEDLWSFLFSTTNWKETLRDELWNIPEHAAQAWGIEELIGDNDANHARHVLIYRRCDLPWDKIEQWLTEKKEDFFEAPPVWMTVDWFDNLTIEVKKNVWKEDGELKRLTEKVAQLTQPR